MIHKSNLDNPKFNIANSPEAFLRYLDGLDHMFLDTPGQERWPDDVRHKWGQAAANVQVVRERVAAGEITTGDQFKLALDSVAILCGATNAR